MFMGSNKPGHLLAFGVGCVTKGFHSCLEIREQVLSLTGSRVGDSLDIGSKRSPGSPCCEVMWVSVGYMVAVGRISNGDWSTRFSIEFGGSFRLKRNAKG